jgi:hypothetical protein
MVTVALAVESGKSLEMAVTVTVEPVGGVCGGV